MKVRLIFRRAGFPPTRLVLALCLAPLLLIFQVHCGFSGQSDASIYDFQCDSPANYGARKNIPFDYSSSKAFTMVSDKDWDETAVRQVLHVFAYGGMASDGQIKAWADMSPDDAIREMLTFDPVNIKLSPPDPGGGPYLRRSWGTLKCLASFWSQQVADNPILNNPLEDEEARESRREGFEVDRWSSPANTWTYAALYRGLNPVRQKIGLWETNYHLAVNLDVGVSPRQMLTYYDNIMNRLAKGEAYQDVLGEAALSAAVATQYNHRENRFEDGSFQGNEDFAREFHQLFFGILGDYNPTYHEGTTIRNTAKALTDMEVEYIEREEEEGDSGYSDQVDFGTEYHFPSPLEILNTSIGGKTARDKIRALAEVAVRHEESLANLPVIIAGGLADDHLFDTSVMDKAAVIRAIWREMDTKNLLEFLRRYAVSTAFHNPSRVKYYSSIDRNLILSNLVSTGNQDVLLELYNPEWFMYNEEVALFRPAHDVFGGQTGLEAIDTGDVFARAYMNGSRYAWYLYRYEEGYTPDGADEEKVVWRKDYAIFIPKDKTGHYTVKHVAEWLWQRFVADGLDNLGSLERAHLYALLAGGRDFPLWYDETQPEAGANYTKDKIETDPVIQERLRDAAVARISLDSDDLDTRLTANYRVGMAINFISATPYMFAQTGR